MLHVKYNALTIKIKSKKCMFISRNRLFTHLQIGQTSMDALNRNLGVNSPKIYDAILTEN